MRSRLARLGLQQISGRLWGLAFLSALLQLLPFPLAGPVPPWRRLLCWLCLVPLFTALSGKDRLGKEVSVPQAACLAYGCGVAWFFGNCYWIYGTMFLYGGLPAAASAGILVLFSLYLGLYFALFGAAFGALRAQFGSRIALLVSPVVWVAVELARARITGFPWDLLGYTQVDNSLLTPLAPYTGVIGLSLVVAAGNALWLWRPAAKLQWPGPVLASCLMAMQVAGAHRAVRAELPDAAAILLQDNLSVGVEGRGERESQAALLQSFAGYTARPEIAAELAAATGHPPRPAIIAWPEAPADFVDGDPALRAAVGAVARAERAPVVVDTMGLGAAPNSTGRYDQFGSASFYLPDGTYAGRYDKMHLVPFGEYTPYKQLFFFAGHLLDGLNFVPGTERRLFSVGGHRYGVFICYESIFGDEVREFAQRGAEVLVNLSDDGWYGDTSAPWEHLDMARMRAIENRRWLLRATNTGVTASIDPEGRIVAALPRHVRDAIEVPFGYRRDMTFYTRHGDWVGWLSAIVVVSMLVGGWLQRRYPSRVRQAG